MWEYLQRLMLVVLMCLTFFNAGVWVGKQIKESDYKLAALEKEIGHTYGP